MEERIDDALRLIGLYVVASMMFGIGLSVWADAPFWCGFPAAMFWLVLTGRISQTQETQEPSEKIVKK